MTNPARRFIVYASFSIGLIVYWYLSMSQTDFPTGEVQYAVMPALLHPYQFAWQAPYGVLWYAVQYFVSYTILPFVSLFHLDCPNNCYAIINYINGTKIQVPFDGGLFQYYLATAWMIGLTIWNLPFIYYLRNSNLLAPYFMTSMWLWATTPVNLSILWIIILAYKSPAFLPLALMAKFPVGAPGAVWKFALGSGETLGHWFPYVLLGFWFVPLTMYWVDYYSHHGNLHWFTWLNRYSRVISEYE